MEKFMILELGQEIWKMSLEHLVWCENFKKKVLKKCLKNEADLNKYFTIEDKQQQKKRKKKIQAHIPRY